MASSGLQPRSALLPTVSEYAGVQALAYMSGEQGPGAGPELGNFGPGGFGSFAPLPKAAGGPPIIP